jgi:sarcosine oxidase subunit gamma
LKALSIVDVSSRSLGIIVAGPNAEALISAGCPLDLARMAPGRATRTLFETVEIILIRDSAARFHIEVWRSFAPWLFAALSAASPI